MSTIVSQFDQFMQATPNYPPYALEVVSELGGKAVFGGNISQALMASLNADEVLACDINRAVVDFYMALVAEIKATKSRAQLLQKFNTALGNHKRGATVVSIGPRSFVPFLLDDQLYQAVREEIGKVKIHQVDFAEFLNWLREERYTASVIDGNNIPEYIGDWVSLFSRPPLKEGGMMFFGKRNSIAYITPDQRLHPGVISPGLSGYALSAPPGGLETSVALALGGLGYVPASVNVISGVVEKPDGKLIFERRKSSGGAIKIIIMEECYQCGASADSLPRIVGSTHTIFTMQYNPTEARKATAPQPPLPSRTA